MNNIKEKLKEVTKRDDKEIAIIDDILNSHFIVGKSNKEKIVNEFEKQLNIDEDEANKLYETAIEIIATEIGNKLTHPFSSKK